jgi:hypothetical protein
MEGHFPGVLAAILVGAVSEMFSEFINLRYLIPLSYLIVT